MEAYNYHLIKQTPKPVWDNLSQNKLWLDFSIFQILSLVNDCPWTFHRIDQRKLKGQRLNKGYTSQTEPPNKYTRPSGWLTDHNLWVISNTHTHMLGTTDVWGPLDSRDRCWWCCWHCEEIAENVFQHLGWGIWMALKVKQKWIVSVYTLW